MPRPITIGSAIWTTTSHGQTLVRATMPPARGTRAFGGVTVDPTAGRRGTGAGDRVHLDPEVPGGAGSFGGSLSRGGQQPVQQRPGGRQPHAGHEGGHPDGHQARENRSSRTAADRQPLPIPRRPPPQRSACYPAPGDVRRFVSGPGEVVASVDRATVALLMTQLSVLAGRPCADLEGGPERVGD
jgi:hypothetical protein